MELEFQDIDKRNAWGRIFQEIKNESNNFDYIIKDAKKSENKNLNRYRDVNPFDHSRVRLKRGDKDYINASLVSVSAADRTYILTQGPLFATTGHFWLMVWEQKSKAILMLNRVIEKNAVKCHQYWPIGLKNGGFDDMVLTDVNLKITILSEREESHYTVREFLITDLQSSDSRNVLQFHYTTWPDFGVPESPAAFLNFLFAVRASGALNSNVGPPVVHCSAGIGRSGTFCLVDSCLLLIEKNNNPDCVNIREILLEMRRYRMGLIQTPDQLRFSYVAIIEGAKQVLQVPSNVPLQNKNYFKQSDKIFDGFPNNASKELNELNGSSPPPLPPRSLRNIVNDRGDSESEDESDIISSPSCSSAAESPSELRKRTRKEREEKTAALVQSIKKKQKEAEKWDKRRSIIKLSLGLVLIIGFGYFVYKNYSKT